MASLVQTVDYVSTVMVKPPPKPLPESVDNTHLNLTPWELDLLTCHYIQIGLLYSDVSVSDQVMDRLASSLSAALYHFYPLACRLKTETDGDGNISVTIDLDAVEGVQFVHSIANKLAVADVADDEVPYFVSSFFPLNGAINHDGHFLALFVVQLTELTGGMFLGFSFNNVACDGISLMHFLKSWTEICRNTVDSIREVHPMTIPHPPLFERWFAEGVNPPIKLPFRAHEFMERVPPPSGLRMRMFHFSRQSIAQLKSKATDECKIYGYTGQIFSGFDLIAVALHDPRVHAARPAIKRSAAVWPQMRGRGCSRPCPMNISAALQTTYTGHNGWRIGWPRGRMGCNVIASERGISQRCCDPKDIAGMGGSTVPLLSQLVRPVWYSDRGLPRIRPLRVRFRVGKSSGGTGWSGDQVRWEGTSVHGAKRKRQCRCRGYFDAGSHGCAPVG